MRKRAAMTTRRCRRANPTTIDRAKERGRKRALSPRGRRARAARGAPAPRPTSVAMGRASRRFRPIGSPVSSQYPYEPSSMRDERRVDLGDELALTVARTQLQRAVGLRGGAVGEIGMLRRFLVQPDQRLARLADDLVFPGNELLAEVHPLPLVHERLVLARTVVRRQHNRRRLGACRHLFPRNLLLYDCLLVGRLLLDGLLVCDRFRF